MQDGSTAFDIARNKRFHAIASLIRAGPSIAKQKAREQANNAPSRKKRRMHPQPFLIAPRPFLMRPPVPNAYHMINTPRAAPAPTYRYQQPVLPRPQTTWSAPPTRQQYPRSTTYQQQQFRQPQQTAYQPDRQPYQQTHQQHSYY